MSKNTITNQYQVKKKKGQFERKFTSYMANHLWGEDKGHNNIQQNNTFEQEIESILFN